MPEGIDPETCAVLDKKMALSIKGKDLSPSECISTYLIKILNYEVLHEVYAGLPDDAFKDFTIGIADKMVNGIVNAAVSPAWASMEKAAKPKLYLNLLMQVF